MKLIKQKLILYFRHGLKIIKIFCCHSVLLSCAQRNQCHQRDIQPEWPNTTAPGVVRYLCPKPRGRNISLQAGNICPKNFLTYRPAHHF